MVILYVTIFLSLKQPVLERVERIELSNSPWQGLRLPLHHTRTAFIREADLVLMSGIEPPASSLPRRYSTTELHQPIGYSAVVSSTTTTGFGT